MLKRFGIVCVLFLSISAYAVETQKTYKDKIPEAFSFLGDQKNITIHGVEMPEDLDKRSVGDDNYLSQTPLPFSKTINTETTELKTYEYSMNTERTVSSVIYYGFGKVYQVDIIIKVPYQRSRVISLNDGQEKMSRWVEDDIVNYLTSNGFEDKSMGWFLAYFYKRPENPYNVYRTFEKGDQLAFISDERGTTLGLTNKKFVEEFTKLNNERINKLKDIENRKINSFYNEQLLRTIKIDN